MEKDADVIALRNLPHREKCSVAVQVFGNVRPQMDNRCTTTNQMELPFREAPA